MGAEGEEEEDEDLVAAAAVDGVVVVSGRRWEPSSALDEGRERTDSSARRMMPDIFSYSIMYFFHVVNTLLTTFSFETIYRFNL